MTLSKQANYLYLYCIDLKYYPENYNAFIQACLQRGLIAPSSLVSADEYLVGDEFLQQITFMGCSPYLKVFPDNDHDTDFCRVTIPSNSSAIEYKAGQQATAPRCPTCRKAGELPQDIIQQWQKDKKDVDIFCVHCEQSSSLYQLDWRRNAGFVQFYIRISNIFPKEAIPSQALLDWLANVTKREWKYFYV